MDGRVYSWVGEQSSVNGIHISFTHITDNSTKLNAFFNK